jgi:hypothetical protein
MRGSVGAAFTRPFDAAVHKAVTSFNNNSALSTGRPGRPMFVLCSRLCNQAAGPQPWIGRNSAQQKNKRRLSTGQGGAYHDDYF